MPKKLSAEQAEVVECELIDWLIEHCPVCMSERAYRRVASKFLAGHLIVVKGPINPEAGKVEIWVE